MDSVILKPMSLKSLYDALRKVHGFILVEGYDEKVNRAAVESRKVNVLLSPEKQFSKDSLQQRHSGLNHILCKLAAQHNVGIGIDVDFLLHQQSEGRVHSLGKIMQNISLCNKYRVKQYLIDRKGRNEKDLKKLGYCLGIPPGKVHIITC